MNTHADKKQESRLPAGRQQSHAQSVGAPAFQLVDNRPEAIAQRHRQGMADNSPQVKQLRAFQETASNSPQAKQIAQLQAMANDRAAPPVQKEGLEEEELLQGKFAPVQRQADPEEEELLQGKFAPIQNQGMEEEALQRKAAPIQKKENDTGLPDNLKTGMENLSGLSLDDVKVHRNSGKPQQLQAHAYAQGTDIHLGPGQEKHLPHEAWHVVQQKQGRVRPTMQMKGGANINDDKDLEQEADMMGAKALQMRKAETPVAATFPLRTHSSSSPPVVQRNGLVDLMMKTGGLDDLNDKRLGVWGGLAEKLNQKATAYLEEQNRGKGEDDKADVFYLGKIVLTADNPEGIFEAYAGFEDEALGNEVKDFLIAFMEVNGQLGYIQEKDWFTSGEWKVVIIVNFYPNRGFGRGTIDVHKDTAAENLFVNLIFNNAEETPATEWTQDPFMPDQARMEELEQALPPGALEEIIEAKDRIAEVHEKGRDQFEGGVAEKPNTFVSWVDELIWHASPVFERRKGFSLEYAVKTLDRFLKKPEKYLHACYEVMVVLAQTPETSLYKVFGERPQDFTLATWDKIYNDQVKVRPSLQDRFRRDLNKAQWEGVPVGAVVGNALNREEERIDMPTLVGNRPRANSVEAVGEQVKAAAQKTPVRSFMRTWVTLKKNE